MAEDAATGLKNSALFQAKWDEQLSSAPKAINSLAALLVESAGTSLNVRMNAVQSSDIGRKALYEAVARVENIQLQFNTQLKLPLTLFQPVMESQGDPSLGELVIDQLKSVERSFQDNMRHITQAAGGFDQWARSVGELQELAGRENVTEPFKQSLEQLKQQTGNLVSFFGAFRSLLEAASTQVVRKLTSLAADVYGSGQNPSESQISELINSLAAVRLYLVAVTLAAEAWVLASQQFILPGLSLSEELEAYASQGETEVVKKKSSEVERWSQQSASRVEEAGRERQQIALENIESNAQKLKRMLQKP